MTNNNSEIRNTEVRNAAIKWIASQVKIAEDHLSIDEHKLVMHYISMISNASASKNHKKWYIQEIAKLTNIFIPDDVLCCIVSQSPCELEPNYHNVNLEVRAHALKNISDDLGNHAEAFHNYNHKLAQCYIQTLSKDTAPKYCRQWYMEELKKIVNVTISPYTEAVLATPLA